MGQSIGVRQAMWVGVLGELFAVIPVLYSPLRAMRELPGRPTTVAQPVTPATSGLRSGDCRAILERSFRDWWWQAMPDVKHFDSDTVLDQVMRLFWERGAATAGIAEVVDATGLSRSSLYATFGGKRELYVTALRRYVERQSHPVFERLAADGRGLPAITEFFNQLVRARCGGEYARWGCMVSNAHAGPDRDDPQVRRILDEHHHGLRAAMRAALRSARASGQIPTGVDLDAAADLLALLAYGMNLRSRAGAPAADLIATATTALHALTGSPSSMKGSRG